MEFSKLKITSKKFIGHEMELDTIRNILKKTEKGIGNLILIEGEAGIGKTRLITELIEMSKNVKFHNLRGRCKYHQGLDPYSPFIEALRNWFGISENGIGQKDNVKDRVGQHIKMVSPELISIIPLIRGFLSAGSTLYGSYLFKGNDIDKSFRTFKELVSENKNGLIITRAHPEEIQELYNLKNTKIYWLTKSNTDLPSFEPSQIEKIRWIIKDFVSENKDSVVLLDGLEYLILQNNFENVLKFVELLKDDIALNDGVLLLPIDPATLDERQTALLERYMRVLISNKKESITSKSKQNVVENLFLDYLTPENPLRTNDFDYVAEKDKMFEAILQLLKNISSKRTLVLILDDLHWADYSSIQLIQYLFQNIINDRILIIGAYRPEEISEGNNYIHHLIENINRLKLNDRFLKLEMHRLSQPETILVAKEIVSEDVPANFLTMIYDKTEGNPLYIEEIIKSLLVTHSINLDSKEWFKNFDSSKLDIPDSISEVIRMRIDRVTKGNDLMDQILKHVSIIGSTFNFDVLLESMKLDEELLLDNIEQLMKANIIHEIDDDRYKFDHTLIREVIYNTLGSRRKRILHAKVGYSIEKLYKNNLEVHYAELALHFSNGGIIEKAVFYSIKEGEYSKEICAYDEALFHYRSALEMLKTKNEQHADLDLLINLYLNLGDLSLVLGAWAEAKKYFENALKLSKESGDDLKRIESRSKLGQIEIKKKRWSLAIKNLEEVMNIKLDDKHRAILLVTIAPKYIMRANMSLIEILLKEDLKGIYICINHPSNMMDKLLKTHKIPTQNIMYLDFITPMTGVLQEQLENAYIIDNAFSLDKLANFITKDQRNDEKFPSFNINNIDFIMVDNISNLVTYTTQEKIEGFIKELISIIKKLTILYGIVLIDNQTSSETKRIIEHYFDNTVTIKEEWL